MGVSQDPFESFRKQRAGAFYTRMKTNADEKKREKKERAREEEDKGEYGDEEYGSGEYG